MKALLAYWWNKKEENVWKQLFLTFLAILLAFTILDYILPKEFGRIFSFDANKFGFLMVFECSAILSAMMLVVCTIGTGRDVLRAIRFRKAFGFWLPSTADGMVGVKESANQALKKFAKRLQDHFDAEEIIRLNLRNAEGPKHALALERNLRQHQSYTKGIKKAFYSRRNLAKAVGFETKKSYKEYLLALLVFLAIFLYGGTAKANEGLADTPSPWLWIVLIVAGGGLVGLLVFSIIQTILAIPKSPKKKN